MEESATPPTTPRTARLRWPPPPRSLAPASSSPPPPWPAHGSWSERSEYALLKVMCEDLPALGAPRPGGGGRGGGGGGARLQIRDAAAWRGPRPPSVRFAAGVGGSLQGAAGEVWRRGVSLLGARGEACAAAPRSSAGSIASSCSIDRRARPSLAERLRLGSLLQDGVSYKKSFIMRCYEGSNRAISCLLLTPCTRIAAHSLCCMCWRLVNLKVVAGGKQKRAVKS